MYQKDYENNEGQQLHQYPQNETLHRSFIEHIKRPRHMALEIQVRGLRQAHNCGGDEPIYGIPTLPLITGFLTTM